MVNEQVQPVPALEEETIGSRIRRFRGDAGLTPTELAEKAQIPVITTFLGIGGFPESHVLSYGWLGMHGMF